MSWTAIAALALGTYLLKAFGLFVMRGRSLGVKSDAIVAALPAALIAGLAVVQSVQGQAGMTLDARSAGAGAALLAVSLRAPFVVVVGVAVFTAATLRWLL